MPTSIVLPDALADRIGMVASLSHRTPLCIVQLCLNAHLPALEEAAKHLAVFHPEPASKPISIGAHSFALWPENISLLWELTKKITKRNKAIFDVIFLAGRKLWPEIEPRDLMYRLGISSQNHKRLLAITNPPNESHVSEAELIVQATKHIYQ